MSTLRRLVVPGRVNLRRAAKAVGIEGAFLSAGTVCLAVFASFIDPAGPWLVGGLVLFSTGVVLALPAKGRG